MNACIGIDIGGTNIRGALFDGHGSIIDRFKQPCGISGGKELFLSQLMRETGSLHKTAEQSGFRVDSVGVGVPGLISRDGVVVSSVNLQAIEGVNLASVLSAGLGLPVVCENDANLIAVGEHSYGAGKGFASLVVLTIGTGLGSGLILENRLWSGAGGFAAEFGHVTVEPDGLPCPCGNRGCLEQYVSASALVRHAGGGTPEGLAKMASAGDLAAKSAFDKTGKYLGIAVAGLLNSLNLELIVLGGGVSASFDLIKPAMMDEVNRRCFPAIASGVKCLPAMLGDDAGLVGAAMTAREKCSSGIRCH